MTLPFQRIAVFGPGLLGGSIAMAVHAAMPQAELRIWARRTQPLDFARKLGLTDCTTTDAAVAAKGADLIILATPIGVFEDLAHRMLPCVGRDCVVTDVGSVKAYVHRTTGEFLTGRHRIFIGSHPMAGAEKQGIESASADLLEGATVALTNPHHAAPEYVERLARFWQMLGCSTYEMEPANHDQTVARISHVPHILAALCARAATFGPVPMADLQRLAATGFRDTTRVCSGPAGMWADILWENDVAVRAALESCITDLQKLRDLLEEQDKTAVREWLETAKQARETIRQEEV